MNKHGYLELILGCMWSGKSTKLLALYKKYKLSEYNPIIINYSAIKNDTNVMTTHDNQTIDCLYVSKLSEIFDIHNPTSSIDNNKTLLINEGQFFPDLYEWCSYMVNIKHKVIHIAALDGDFKTQGFDNILNLLPQADSFHKLTAICTRCKDGTPAIFTHRISDNTERILFDSSEYTPLCRKCYNKSI